MKRSETQRANVRLAARAKINLRLNILAREASGYHQIETIFAALDFADDVEIALGGSGLRFEVESVDGADAPSGPDNLAYRAAERFFSVAGIPAAAAIRLKKRIPVGAGLGGGSSDAATVLKGLNLLAHNPLDDAQLVSIGAELGADVPFFLCGSSFALGWGRGQRLLPLQPLPALPVLLLVPAFPIATKDAYQALSDQGAGQGAQASIVDPARLQSWEALRDDAANDFEPALFPRYPMLAELKAALLEAGASMAMLSGSGSTVFGLFELERTASRAGKRLRDRFPDLRAIETHTITWTGR